MNTGIAVTVVLLLCFIFIFIGFFMTYFVPYVEAMNTVLDEGESAISNRRK